MKGDGILPISQSHAIYPTKGNEFYYAALVGSKFISTLGIFLLFDTLRIFPLLYVCFFLAFWTFLVNFALHKYSRAPLYPSLKHNQWILTALYSAFGAFLSLIWLTGLRLCGPYRFVLIFKQPEAFMVAVAGSLFFDSKNQGRRQGAAFFMLAIGVILFFDHDSHRSAVEHPEGTHTSSVQHVLAWWLGLSDHKLGVLLLAFALALQLVHSALGRRIAASAMVGNTGLGLPAGQRRLALLSTAFQTAFFVPLALFAWGNSTDSVSWSSIFISWPVLLIVALFSLVLESRMAEVAASRIGPLRATQVASVANIVGGFILSFCCSCTFISVYSRQDLASITNNHELHHIEAAGSESVEAHHQISGGLVCALLLLLYSLYQVTSSASGKGGRSGKFIGYSPANGMPMYVVSEQSAGMVSQKGTLLAAAGALFRSTLQHILEDAQSKRIFYYLCLNLSFSFVELLYGALSNSLGLISDGVHMLFDCSALVLGLIAAVMARSPPTRVFTYGFDRVELLSGYVNALFLVVIALFIFATAVRRLFAPPEIHSERLLLVSVLGLLVNLVGLFSLGGHAHSHGGGAHGHSHGGGGEQHGHSHGAAPEHSHSHSHAGGHKAKKHRHSSSCDDHHEHSTACAHTHSHTADACHDEHHEHEHERDHLEVNIAGSSSDAHDDDSHEFFEHSNANMRGVFLHVLADTLGSVGVIVSSFLISNLGWFWADPLVSLILALMIGASAWPLLSDTASVLLLRAPPAYAERAEKLERKILSHVPGAVAVRRLRLWQHSAALHFAAVNIQVAEDVDAQAAVLEATAVLKKEGVSRVIVQVEKDSLYDILALIQSTASSARFLPFTASSSSLWTSNSNH